MAKRTNPAEQQRKRDELRREIEEPAKPISLGMMPLGPEDLRGIFRVLKAFRTKFPTQAEGLIARVGKMLKATPEEMEAGMKVRPRDDWQGYGRDAPTPGWRRMNAWDQPKSYGLNGPPVVLPNPVKQGPNTKRAQDAAVKATEKIVSRVEAAIKNAPKK
jgi:hypothetical protein